jgi:simple sugar transport system permease protein
MRDIAQTLVITLAALVASMALFSAFMYAYASVSPVDLFYLMYYGSCGSTFSIQNSLEKAAPLILTALCTALPARVGLINIGGEGSLVLGGLAAVSTGLLLQGSSPTVAQVAMGLAGMLVGGLLIAFVGMLRHWRGVNETISSLLMVYIAIKVFNFLVEGPMKDPSSANKPSTFDLAEALWVGKMPGTDIHWGLALGILFCLVSYLLMYHTTFGFAASMIGGNVRAAQGAGLPVGWVIFITCFLAGSAAGLAGMVEVATGEHRANASLIADYGFTGILVSFMARHHPLGIIPVAFLFGGLGASSGLVQRRLHVPEASIQVFMGIMFVTILAFETFYGRFRIFQPRQLKEAPAT